jgi:hypothetical protein
LLQKLRISEYINRLIAANGKIKLAYYNNRDSNFAHINLEAKWADSV